VGLFKLKLGTCVTGEHCNHQAMHRVLSRRQQHAGQRCVGSRDCPGTQLSWQATPAGQLVSSLGCGFLVQRV
jgi:hypothetical protein